MLKEIAASLLFFTRFPFYKLKCFNIPSQYFKQVINYWPLAGWLTGGVMALTLGLTSMILPYSVAIILAVASRVLVTGALHEDGLSDFMDGLGGGSTRTRVLEIMKDSHIGTYGVLTHVIYFMLLFSCLYSVDTDMAMAMIFISDPLAKLVASHINKVLPYARTQETSKAKVVYDKMNWKTALLVYPLGLFPFMFIIPYQSWWIILFPIVTFVLIVALLKKRIQGYTGDSCGAMFLLCELSVYLGILITINNQL